MEEISALQAAKRVLAAAAAAATPLDYTVLSVGVITLGLILVVELIRHRLDVAAMGRIFFKSVLEGVYRECKYRSFENNAVAIQKMSFYGIPLTH